MLTVICGGMFSEKTTELLRRGRRLERANKSVKYFKPSIDIRYSEKDIVSHDKVSQSAIPIDIGDPDEIIQHVNYKDHTILIDEVQFFSLKIIDTIDFLLANGFEVIVAGLDLDFKAKPFKVTMELMAIAENVVKLSAVCEKCGKNSWVSYRSENVNVRVQLGSDEYTPLCRKCYIKQREKEEVVIYETK